jgi:hypothetical protein
MPQLSLYIEEKTLKKIELAAKINHTSISRWVTARLKESLENNWPENYENLFGCIEDDTFSAKRNEKFSDDVEREEF